MGAQSGAVGSSASAAIKQRAISRSVGTRSRVRNRQLHIRPLIGITIWWMLPQRGIVSSVSRVALIVYVPLYVAVDAVLGIGSSILIRYRQGLAPSDRSGVDGAFEALFFAPSAIDWLDQGASLALQIGALAAALALWRDYGWRVSVPLALAGYVLAQSHFPPAGAIAGLALGIAVWQYLVTKQYLAGQPSPPNPSTT